jgi:hypothetical protein
MKRCSLYAEWAGGGSRAWAGPENPARGHPEEGARLASYGEGAADEEEDAQGEGVGVFTVGLSRDT